MGIDHSDLVVTTVAVAVVVTLTFQATTKRWLARRLDLLEDGEYVHRAATGFMHERIGLTVPLEGTLTGWVHEHDR